MSARLVPLSPGPVPTIPVQRPVMLIGRHPECDVRIDLATISRRHCCVALAYDRVVIRDLGSRNGLRVNGRVVEEVQLRSGDEVAIGPLVFRFDAPAPPPSPAPASKSAGPDAAKPNPGPPSIAAVPDPVASREDLVALDP